MVRFVEPQASLDSCMSRRKGLARFVSLAFSLTTPQGDERVTSSGPPSPSQDSRRLIKAEWIANSLGCNRLPLASAGASKDAT